MGSECRPAEVQLTAAYGIHEGGKVGLGAAAVSAHRLQRIHRHLQCPLVVAFLQQHLGQATG